MAKVTDIINKKYLEDNGSFIITDKNGNYKYGNIISDQTPEFKNYKFDNLYPTLLSINQLKFFHL